MRTPGANFKAAVLKPMYKILLALSLTAFATFSTAQTPGSAQTAVLATVHQFVHGFNKGDTKVLLAACADQTSILDEFPPHEWHGTGACAKWVSDFDADAKKNGITDGVVTLRNWLNHFAHPAKEPSRLANHGMVMGETLGAVNAAV